MANTEMLVGPLLLLLAPAATVLAQTDDTWVYGEALNYCMAFFRESPTQLVVRFSAKTNDDTIQVWRKGLPSLTRGMNREQRDAAASRLYDLELLIAGRAIPLASQTGNLRPKNVPGVAYVLGVDERAFIEALADGSELEVRRAGTTIVTYRIRDGATLAKRLSACVASP